MAAVDEPRRADAGAGAAGDRRLCDAVADRGDSPDVEDDVRRRADAVAQRSVGAALGCYAGGRGDANRKNEAAVPHDSGCTRDRRTETDRGGCAPGTQASRPPSPPAHADA